MGNETEALSYAESLDWTSRSVPVIAQQLANLPKKNTQRKRTVIITQGTAPTIVAVQGESSPRQFNVKAIAKEEIVDTNGAGDAFAGGFVAGLVQGKDIDTCVDMGSWLAKLGLTQLGPS